MGLFAFMGRIDTKGRSIGSDAKEESSECRFKP